MTGVIPLLPVQEAVARPSVPGPADRYRRLVRPDPREHTVPMQLVERDGATAALQEYASDASGGNGRLVLLTGEAGIGKTALLERFRRTLPDARWSWGEFDSLLADRPLGPFLDVAEQLGVEVGAVLAADQPRTVLADEIGRRLRDPDVLDVVVLEDAHWADEAILLLRHLARGLRDARALIVLTYRETELRADHPLRLALGELATGSWCRRIGLAPLTRAAVAQLLGDSPLDPQAVHDATGGNPFFVTEVVRSGEEGVPPTARDVVLGRAAALTADSRAVLERIALLGLRVDLPLLEALWAGDLAGALDDLLASGLLVDDGTGLRFRHEIARRAIADSVPTHRSVPLHARAFDALLARRTTDAARLAFHAAGARDAARVLEHAPAAARAAAALGAHSVAVDHAASAVRFAADGDPVVLAALRDDLATELAFVDRWEEAAVEAEAALAVWRSIGEGLRAAGTLRRLSRIMWRLCRGADATARAEEAMAVLEPLDPGPELAWATANLATQRMLASRWTDAIELARRARDLGERWRLPAVVSDALDTEACSSAIIGLPWEEPLRAALAIALEHGVQEQAGRAFTNLAGSLLETYRPVAAEAVLDAGAAYCEEHDLDAFGTCIGGHRSALLADSGRFREAIALGGRMLARSPSPVNRLYPLLAAGRSSARLGEGDHAWPRLDEALRLAIGTEEPEWIVLVRFARAEARWLEGDTGSARTELQEALALPGSPQVASTLLWLRRIGAPLPRPAPAGTPAMLLAELDGRADEAALAWAEIDRPYDAALALLGGGEERQLLAALAAFERSGAVPAARITRERMRRGGMRRVPAGATRSTRSDPRGLTVREREVLDRLVAGRSNREIAAELVLSAKTVDHHVSAVLGKLGVHTRQEAAAMAVAAPQA